MSTAIETLTTGGQNFTQCTLEPNILQFVLGGGGVYSCFPWHWRQTDGQVIIPHNFTGYLAGFREVSLTSHLFIFLFLLHYAPALQHWPALDSYCLFYSTALWLIRMRDWLVRRLIMINAFLLFAFQTQSLHGRLAAHLLALTWVACAKKKKRGKKTLLLCMLSEQQLAGCISSRLKASARNRCWWWSCCQEEEGEGMSL